VRVTPSGNPGTPFVICNRSERQANPDITFDGTNFITVWTDESYSPTAICGARVTPSGQVLDPNGKPLITGSATWGSPKLAFDGTNLMLAYREVNLTSGTVYGQRLTTSLQKIGNPFAISTSTLRKYDVRIAYSGSNYLVTWLEGNFLSAKILGRIVNKDGSLPGSEFTIVSGLSQSATFDLCFDGTYYLLIFSNGTQVKGQRISTSGQLVGSAFSIGSGIDPAVCYSSGDMLITYSKRISDYDIYGTVEYSNIGTRPATRLSHPVQTLYGDRFQFQPGDRVYDSAGRRVVHLSPGIYFLRRGDQLIKIIKVR